MEGHRHSIDVPISRTLIALRRVRSLRDPSTNSMCRLSSLVDNVNWETNSKNAIVLGFENGCYDDHTDKNVLGLKGSTLFKEQGAGLLSPKASGGLSRSTGTTPLRSFHVEGSDMRITNHRTACENKAPRRRYYKDGGGKRSELICAAPSNGCIDGGDSCNELGEKSKQAEKRCLGVSKRKSWRKKHERVSRVAGGDVLSCADSQCCLSTCNTPRDLSHGISFYGDEDDDDMMEPSNRGCGISSCWSGSLKFRESSLVPDVEERPLLLENSRGVLLTGETIDWKHDGEGVSPYVESPRNLCQKFMPKSFSELVGQNIIARSLLSSILNKRISSLYLFHGPRGTGKTSASRIFAAALNCVSPKIDRPCGLCQECVLFFSGKSRDVKEVDSVRINKIERCRSLIKNTEFSPVFSRYKVYIIDECHLLHGETWATLLSSLDELPRHVVFIMVTPDLDKLPRAAVAKSQRFHFQKIKEIDISKRLEKICVDEGHEFELDALNFIASKSNGSLRDAEMMLDQLTLLGKKITVALVYEVNGVVSDDELLDLLHLALSSDASNTVKRARELMRSRIDPLQLISQLANLIMDILAGKWPYGISEAKQKLFGTDNSEADMQQLSNALKVLSETEKQLRMSKNQTTWLTVALLQLSSVGPLHDVGDARSSMRMLHPHDGDFPSTSSTSESLKLPIVCACDNIACGNKGSQDGKETLEVVWNRAISICLSNSLRRFLQKRGKLVSVCLNQGIAVAELEFDCPDSISKAEKSWKVIASALQHILGHNVELRMNLADSTSKKDGKFKKPFFNLFGCSRQLHLRSELTTESESNVSETSDVTPKMVITSRNKYVSTCSSECGSLTCYHGNELVKTIRNIDGNALSVGINTPHTPLPHNTTRGNPLNEGNNTACSTCDVLRPQTESRGKEFMKFRCWRTFRKAWQLKHHNRTESMVHCPLPCAAAK